MGLPGTATAVAAVLLCSLPSVCMAHLLVYCTLNKLCILRILQITLSNPSSCSGPLLLAALLLWPLPSSCSSLLLVAWFLLITPQQQLDHVQGSSRDARAGAIDGCNAHVVQLLMVLQGTGRQQHALTVAVTVTISGCT